MVYPRPLRNREEGPLTISNLVDPDWADLLRSAPHFVDDSQLDDLLAHFARAGARSFVFDFAVTDTFDVNRVLRDEGQVPDWTGPSWASLWDVLDEVRELWDRPVVLAIRRVDRLVRRDPQETMNLTTNLSLFAKDLSAIGPAVLPLLTMGSR